MYNKLWLGYGFKGGAGHFISKYEDKATAGDHREGMIRVSGVNWFTNLEIKKRQEELILYKNYSPDEYPVYDNYDAIEVSKTELIPCDYDGLMGVPITFMDKYNPNQFEIVALTDRDCPLCTKKYTANDFKNYSDLNRNAVLNINGTMKSLYTRILIKRKS